MPDELTLDTWDRLPTRERQARAKKLARDLPNGFAFRELELHKLGDQQHRMAVFSFEDAAFVLIPGGEVTLGYDAKRPWEPMPEEKESWQDTVEEFELRGTIKRYIARVTRRPKKVHLQPFLMETTAGEIGWEPIPFDDPRMSKTAREYLRCKPSSPHTMTVHSGDEQIRIQWLKGGAVRVERALVLTHAELAKALAKSEFRFPTSDEWEYACSGGATTLFRWGDHVPCDRYPIDSDPAAEWDLHRRPNAFGLFMASDPYQFELTAEPGITRGGDGGCTICGGMGFFVGWMTLATAYFEKEACKHDLKEPVASGYTIGRRVLPLT